MPNPGRHELELLLLSDIMWESILRRILKLKLRWAWMRMRMRRTIMSRFLFRLAIGLIGEGELVRL